MPMSNILYEALKQNILPDYLSQLLSAFPVDESENSAPLKGQSTRSKLVEPLSDSEIEVLHFNILDLGNCRFLSRN